MQLRGTPGKSKLLAITAQASKTGHSVTASVCDAMFWELTQKDICAGYPGEAKSHNDGHLNMITACDALSCHMPALPEGQAGIVTHSGLCAGHCGAGRQCSTGLPGAAAACNALAARSRDPARQSLTASLHSYACNKRSLQGELVQQPGAVVQAQQSGSSHWARSALLLASNALQLPQQTQAS